VPSNLISDIKIKKIKPNKRYFWQNSVDGLGEVVMKYRNLAVESAVLKLQCTFILSCILRYILSQIRKGYPFSLVVQYSTELDSVRSRKFFH